MIPTRTLLVLGTVVAVCGSGHKNFRDIAKPVVRQGRKATGLESRQPGCLIKKAPGFCFLGAGV